MAEPTTKPPIELKCIKEDATVTVDIPSALYVRLQNLLLTGIPFSSPEKMQKTLAIIKNSEDDPDPQTYHTRTILWLLSQIEQAAEKQEKFEIKKIDLLTGKPI